MVDVVVSLGMCDSATYDYIVVYWALQLIPSILGCDDDAVVDAYDYMGYRVWHRWVAWSGWFLESSDFQFLRDFLFSEVSM